MQETGALLAMCAAYDSREASEIQLRAWADALAEVPFGEAQAAVKEHYATRMETRRMMPGDVLRLVREARRPSRADRVAELRSRWEAVKACELCDEHGYRLPKRLSLCSHRAPSAIGAAAQVRRMLEAGDAS